MRLQKVKHAENIVSKADFVGFQEVHGSAVVIADHFHKYWDDRHVAWTAFDSAEAASLDYLPICLGSAAGCASSEKSSGQVDSNSFCAAGEVASKGNAYNQDNDSDDSAELSDSNYSHSSDISQFSNTSRSSSVEVSSCSASVGGVISIISKKAFPPGTSFSVNLLCRAGVLRLLPNLGEILRFLSTFIF